MSIRLLLLAFCCLHSTASQHSSNCSTAAEKPSPRLRVQLRNLGLRHYTSAPARKRLLDDCAQKARLLAPFSNSAQSRSAQSWSDSRRPLLSDESTERSLTDYVYQCNRQKKLFEAQDHRSKQRGDGQGRAGIPQGRDVSRVPSEALSYERFIELYDEDPVVVQGMGARMFPATEGRLSLAHIRAKCGEKRVAPLYPSRAPAWGGLEEEEADEVVTLAQFLERNHTEQGAVWVTYCIRFSGCAG